MDDKALPLDTLPELNAKADVRDAENRGQLLSGYEGLSWWQSLKLFKWAALYCWMTCFAGACEGYQNTMNGGLVAQQGFVKQFALTKDSAGKPALSASELVGLGGTPSHVGLIVGKLAIAFLSQKFGRKIGFYTLWLFLTVNVMMESLAKTWPVWMVAKIFAGVGLGALQVLTPTYIAEIAPPRIRGTLMICYAFWSSLGGLLSSIALQVMNDNNPDSYLIPVYTEWAFVGLMIIFYVIIPESPFWCASMNKVDKGREALLRIHRGVKDYDVDRQWAVVTLTVEYEREMARQGRNAKWLDIFRGRDGFRTLVASWCVTGAQFLGEAPLNNYGAYFYQQVGLSNPFATKAITQGPALVVTVILAPLVDRFGRRVLACSALTAMWFAALGFGILGCVEQTSAAKGCLVFIATVSTCADQGVVAIGTSFLGEMPSQQHRAHTAGFAYAVSSTVGLVNNILVPYMVNDTAWNWGLKTFWLYFGLGSGVAINSWFILPEPAGRSPAELNELFESKIKPWRFHKYKTATQLAMAGEQEAE